MARAWEDWLTTARDMLAEARDSHEREKVLTAAFFANQAAESALKAVWIRDGDGNPPRIHDLVQLAHGLDAPADVVNACRELNPLYMTSRYPDAANGAPRPQLSPVQTGRAMDAADVVLGWCADRLNAPGEGGGHAT